jgi:hypothetical protein
VVGKPPGPDLREEVNPLTQTGTKVIEVDEAELSWLLDLLGVNHLAGVQGTEERTVTLSERSSLVCPAHGRTLKPDACRSCAFLAGDLPADPAR